MDKFLSPWNRLPMLENDTGTGGGESSQAAGDAGGAGGDENNAGDNPPDFSTMWDTQGEPDTTPELQKVIIAQESKPTDPQAALEAQVSQMLGSVDFDARAISEGLQEGNAEPLQQAIQGAMGNMAKQLMLTMGRYTKSQMNTAIKQAVEQSTGAVGAGQAVEQMKSALPFTANPATLPMARSVLNQFLQSGKPLDQAIKHTGLYFEQMAQSVNGKRSGGRLPGSGNFNNGNMPNDDDGDVVIDWEEALTSN